MDIQNITDILGDGNFNLQNITGSNINIITGRETDPAITAKKREIANHIAELIKQLDTKRKNPDALPWTADATDFDELDFENLVSAIEYDNCILFIGPELSVDDAGISLHQKFFKSLHAKNTEYDEVEGFFMPGAEVKLKSKMQEYYKFDKDCPATRKNFHNENKNGYAILEKIAQIPFCLIVSAAPDNALQQIFEQHNKKHRFIYFDGTKQEVDTPTKDCPVVFNFLGNPAYNGNYVFTYKQFHKYINEKQDVKVPEEIEAKVMEAQHYLFLGFDFDKWYNRLVMFTFKIDNKGAESPEGYTFSAKNLKPNTKVFINRQFKITAIEHDYEKFVNALLQKTYEKGLSISLMDIFVQNTLATLERIRVKVVDIDKLESLLDIENEMKEIQRKYFHNS